MDAIHQQAAPHITPGLRNYVLLVITILPMDWFDLTGELFREFGAKPATLVLTLGGLYGIFFSRRARSEGPGIELKLAAIFAAWFALGLCAALLNFVLGWSDWTFRRDPLFQLILQSLILMVCAIAVIGNVRLFRGTDVIPYVARVLPWIVLLHLVIFLAEALDLLQDSTGFLALFRTGEMERPTGLFSEPAYFGTFAAIYGTALVMLPASPLRRFVNVLLAAALYASAIVIGAKTFVVVAAAQAAWLMLRRKQGGRRNAAGPLVMFAAVVGCGVFFIQTYSVLNVQENLSSTMRLGSSLLAANVARAGYALTGIGFGQFHFFYQDQFAPAFIFLSREALDQMNPEVDTRASTFNLYLRVLVETGIAGFLLLIGCLSRLWFARIPESVGFVSVIFAGALGFLMTQDTYFYPPLVFAAVLLISHIATAAQSNDAVPCKEEAS